MAHGRQDAARLIFTRGLLEAFRAIGIGQLSPLRCPRLLPSANSLGPRTPMSTLARPWAATEESLADNKGMDLSDPVASPKPVSLNEMVISSRRICRIVSASRKTTKCRTERRVRGLVTDTYSSVPRKAKGKEISRAAGQGAFAPLLPRGRNRGPSNGATGGKYERRRRA